ncbi:CotH kinase family protein, partial [Flavobacteriales bacterium]|nr:CotH kinase family protein [Flavobacteriales bacterium]
MSCFSKKEETFQDNISYFCDAENTIADKKFITNGITFGGGLGISSDEAYEGKYSCKLDKNQKFGMEKTIYDIVPGETVKVSVFRKSIISNNTGYLVISAVNHDYEQILYERINNSFSGTDENGWENITFDIQIPKNSLKVLELKVYVYLGENKKETVYFDNLSIEREFNKLTSINYNKEPISIQMADIHYNKLFAMRDTALIQGVISNNLKKFVPAILSYKGEKFPIEIRIKGDWTDHLIGQKWSFRIRIKKGQSLLGLKQFSIQSPKTRSFLDEWVIHEMCHDEDILSNRYEFYPVRLNGISLGVYALEEHFTKQLVESQNRREGPILKFDESGFWQQQLYHKSNQKYLHKPIFEASKILPFQKGKTIKTENLKNQFLIAQNLMLKYKNGDDDIATYLDIDRLAKAYAIMTIGNVKHAFVWHNQRFYYNPAISKLELIVYDCFPDATENKTKPKIYGDWDAGTQELSPSEYPTLAVFNNEIFKKSYLEYLKKYSSQSYIDNFLLTKNNLIDSLESLISYDYFNYKFDKDLFIQNVKIIRNKLAKYENKIEQNNIKFSIKEQSYKDGTDVVFSEVSLSAHLEALYYDGSVQLSISNYHPESIKIFAYSVKEYRDSIIYLPNPIHVPGNLLSYKTHILNSNPNKLFFKTIGIKSNTTHSISVLPWNRPVTNSELFSL